MNNKDFFIQLWQGEMKRTLKAIEALPSDTSKLAYKPSEKSRSARQLVEHILPHAQELADAVTSFTINEESKPFTNNAEAAADYEKQSNVLAEKLKQLDEKTWNEKIVPLTVNGNKIYEAPMSTMFWTLLFDTVHHRGQLTTYYRPMGVRNPSIYGPTAEDMEERMAAMKN